MNSEKVRRPSEKSANGSVKSGDGPIYKPNAPKKNRHASTTSGRSYQSEVDDGKINLKPKLTLINGITVIVGSIIGSGIFVSPRGVLEQTGSVGLSLTVWTLCGIFSAIGSYCYAELGCAIVRSGADYAYIYEAFGPLLAFLRLWVEAMIVRPCSQAIVALTFSYYVIEPLFPGCEKPQLALQLMAVICICKSIHSFIHFLHTGLCLRNQRCCRHNVYVLCWYTLLKCESLLICAA